MAEIASQEGYQSVTVKKLARLAGVSTGAFYSLFDSKDDCLISLYQVHMHEVCSRVTSTPLVGADPSLRLRLVIRALVTQLVADPQAAHVALVDSFAGGPAAIARVGREEARLSAAVSYCLDLSPDGSQTEIGDWIIAGSMRAARTSVTAGGQASSPDLAEDLWRWATQYLAGDPRDEVTHRVTSVLRINRLPTQGQRAQASGDQRLVEAAVSRLSATRPFWRINLADISETSGLAAARIRRKIGDVESCYLTTAKSVITQYFGSFLKPDTTDENWAIRLCSSLTTVSMEIVATPEPASLAFRRIIEPGLSGLRCKEALIGELAVSLRRRVPSPYEPTATVAEATVAALWQSLAADLGAPAEQGRSLHPARYASIILTPILGAVDASRALAEAGIAPGRAPLATALS